MNEKQQAEILAKYLDDLLRGTLPPDASDLDPEIASLSNVARSLAQVDVAPDVQQHARFERLLAQHRPALQIGGTAMPQMILGLPVKWFGALIALLGGLATTFVGIVIVIIIGRGVFAPGWDIDTPTPIITPTLTVTPTLTAVATVTPSVTLTPTAALSPTLTVTPTATVVPTATVIPTPTVPVTEPARVGLAFHTDHLNAGGKVRSVYQASGSLKNHGPSVATDVKLGWEVIAGADLVERVEIMPAEWAEITTGKPGRFTILVHVNVDALPEQKGTQIVVRIFVEGKPVEATFRIKLGALTDKSKEPKVPRKPEKEDKVGKGKPTPPVKPEPLPKPTKEPRPTKEPKSEGGK